MYRSSISVVFLAILVSISVELAYADGAFVWRNQDEDIREPQQKAFVVQDGRYQELVLSVRFEGAAADFGWLVPLPSRPEMEIAAGPVFETLSKGMQEPFVRTGPTFRAMTRKAGSSRSDVSATFHDVGIYDVAILESTDGESLDDWLDEHGFVLPASAPAVLQEYADKEWFLAAIRIDPNQIEGTTETDLADGEIQPIRFRFESDDLVFPLRISSLNGHPSEVLIYVLADHPVQPRGRPGMKWEIHLKPWQRAAYFIDEFGANDWERPEYLGPKNVAPSYLRDVYDRTRDATDRLWLAKCRTTVEPAQMADLEFEAYDLIGALTSDDPRARIEAASAIGEIGVGGSTEPLIKLLSTRPAPGDQCDQFIRDHLVDEFMPGQDIRSTLWALGQSGDRVAVAELVRWVDEGSPLYRVDAFDGLCVLDPDSACVVALAIVEQVEDVLKLDRGGNRCGKSLYTAAVAHVVAEGGLPLAPELDDLVELYLTPGWTERIKRMGDWLRIDPRADAVAMAAACGVPRAYDVLLQWIVDDAATWTMEYPDGDAIRSRGSSNGFPGGLSMMSKIGGGKRVFDWRSDPPAHRTMDVLLNRPAVRDSLVRSAAAVETLPLFSRATLLGDLCQPRNEDVEHLVRLWHEARSQSRTVHLEFDGDEAHRCQPSITINLECSAIAHAMVRQDSSSELLELWDSVPWDEADIKAEVLNALTYPARSTEVPPQAFGAATEYIRRVWNENARNIDRKQCLSDNPTGGTLWWPYPDCFDAEYRVKSMARLFSPAEWARTAELIEDEDLHPSIRLFWLKEAWLWINNADRARLDAMLDSVGRVQVDPVLVAYHGRLLDHIAKRDEEERGGDG
ncbi:DUF2330 domain-containing protein [bacterium]|nr:DUF2330 domain-containing protein [bacterium]